MCKNCEFCVDAQKPQDRCWNLPKTAGVVETWNRAHM